MNMESIKYNERYFDWVKEESNNILTALGYDVTKDVHEQFLKKMKVNLDGTKPKRGGRRKKMDLPSKDI